MLYLLFRMIFAECLAAGPGHINSTCRLRMELDTATGRNFISEEIWKAMGEPVLEATS